MQKARRRFYAPTACKRTVSGSISLPCSGCFPPFLHSTGSLSVFCEYLALRDGPRGFRQDFTCPALLRITSTCIILRIRGFHPLRPCFPDMFCSSEFGLVKVLQPHGCLATTMVWALPCSLATTGGIIVIFFSCRY